MYKYNNACYASSETQDEKLAIYLKSKATCSCILERREKGLPGLRHSLSETGYRTKLLISPF